MNKRSETKVYSVVVASIFHHYLKFTGQRNLRAEIFGLKYKKNKYLTNKTGNNCFSDVSNTSPTKRKYSAADVERTNKYLSLTAQLNSDKRSHTCAQTFTQTTHKEVSLLCDNITIFIQQLSFSPI